MIDNFRFLPRSSQLPKDFYKRVENQRNLFNRLAFHVIDLQGIFTSNSWSFQIGKDGILSVKTNSMDQQGI